MSKFRARWARRITCISCWLSDWGTGVTAGVYISGLSSVQWVGGVKQRHHNGIRCRHHHHMGHFMGRQGWDCEWVWSKVVVIVHYVCEWTDWQINQLSRQCHKSGHSIFSQPGHTVWKMWSMHYTSPSPTFRHHILKLHKYMCILLTCCLQFTIIQLIQGITLAMASSILMKGFEMCPHTCRDGRCISIATHTPLWRKKGGACSRHITKSIIHQDCTDACPGHVLLHELGRETSFLQLSTSYASCDR